MTQSTQAVAPAAAIPTASSPSTLLILVMAISAGLAAAALYYNQPMLGLLARRFGVSDGTIALIPVLTQFGYALGLFLVTPLGDRVERKRLILGTGLALSACLLAAAFAPGFLWLAAISLAIGILATVAQQIIPLAAHLAPDARRGHIVGTVMSGLLLGILLARAASGLVSEHFGWQPMFVLGALAMLAATFCMALALPRVPPTAHTSYARLLASLFHLFTRHATLRRAAFGQALLFAGFMIFWSELALLLQAPPYHLGGTAIAVLSLAGAAGALAAPFAGHLADRRGPRGVVALGALLCLLSYLLLYLAQGSFVVLLAGAVVMDLGVQSALISNQSRIYALDPASRSRLNTVFMTAMFIGGAAGTTLGSMAFLRWGWSGAMLLAGGLAAIGLVAAVLPEGKGR